MEYKLLEKQDLELMLDFIDDENTKYTIEELNSFISNKNNLGFIAIENNNVIAFSYVYLLTHPDCKKVFYFDAIDVMQDYQGKGIGTELICFVRDYVKKLGCSEMFLITNKNNFFACKCYEKSGGISEASDDVVYIYDFEGDK